MNVLTYMWAKAYLDIVFISFNIIASTAQVVRTDMQERAMLDEIEDHLRHALH